MTRKKGGLGEAHLAPRGNGKEKSNFRTLGWASKEEKKTIYLTMAAYTKIKTKPWLVGKKAGRKKLKLSRAINPCRGSGKESTKKIKIGLTKEKSRRYIRSNLGKWGGDLP